MVVYLSVALILQMKEGLLKLPCEYPAVHQYFQHLPKTLDVEPLFPRALELFKSYPPTELIKVEQVAFPADSPFLISNQEQLRKRGRDAVERIRDRKKHKIGFAINSGGIPFVVLGITMIVASFASLYFRTAEE